MSSKDKLQTKPKKKKKPNNFIHDFIKITGILPALIWLRPKIIHVGKTQPQKIKGRALVVCNHISFTDPVSVLLVFWRRRMRFLATKDLYTTKLKRFLFTNMHCIMVDKENFNVDSLHAAREALENGEIVTIFPEGKVNLNDADHIQPFKKGAVLIAFQGNAPIIPLCLIKCEKKWSRQVILVGDPINISDICGENPPYRELKKVTAYLQEKEAEMLEYYHSHLEKKKNLAVCEQTPSILDIYVAEIPQNTELSSVFPSQRNEEINACSNEKVKREKYYVWKLLEYALANTFGQKIKEVKFTKRENGKWECPVCEFSLSHSKNAVAVALSEKPVGVDIELLSPPKVNGFAERILNEAERKDFASVPQEAQTEYLLGKWTQKESIYKAQPSLGTPKHIDTNSVQTLTKSVTVAGGTYLLSVASENLPKHRFYENIDIKEV